MPGPQGTASFILMVAAFAGLAWTATRPGAFADLTNSGGQAVELPDGSAGSAAFRPVLGNGVTTTPRNLVRAGPAKPVVLVMPDVNGGLGISLQCLNQAHGPQDATYLARDLPTAITRIIRVQPPGGAWGIAGSSEGGFCAANLGLQCWRSYGSAGVLSGYFKPLANRLGNPPRPVSPFAGLAGLSRLNTPDDLVSSLPAGTPVPQFWLGAGTGAPQDVRNAGIFARLLRIRQPGATLRLVPGGGHRKFTWRALVPPMLEWMTPRLARAANRPAPWRLIESSAAAAPLGPVNQVQGPARAAPGADAGPPAAPGAGHLRGRAPPASG